MFDARVSAMREYTIIGIVVILLISASCLLVGTSLGSDDSTAAVTPVATETVESIPVDVHDEKANELIATSISVVNSANTVLTCARRFNDGEFGITGYIKCKNGTLDESISEELQGCLDWCSSCYTEGDTSLDAGCSINETHEENCYSHCVKEYGE